MTHQCSCLDALQEPVGKTIGINVRPDLSILNAQVDEANALLECLPDSVLDSFRKCLSNLCDFRLETETISTLGTSSYILRFRSIALADFCAAAVRATDGKETSA